ncbi:ParB/Srx family N-terminal domain-containing protein [Dyella telluris]|uniref:ParB N-terminal domain-containing protein n=1 Tax=Dyella telluris TaxID=2763498 RepID=A0A7G8Q4H1_9GAMM|nr:ParB/Srx family N-terminal domain-containing protein [Dyella telluris]QNK01679.1 ParB N-terminal domain-containing protein [Dyella telluris]
MAGKPYKPTIESWAIDRIKPYDKNPKIHTSAQVEALAKVIQTQGFDVPIVVDADGVIIKGHGRRLASIHLGLKEVPVIVRSDLTPAQTKAARLSDNRVALGDFDVDMINSELHSLKDEGFELETIGFDDKELEFLFTDLAEVDTSSLVGAIEAARTTSVTITSEKPAEERSQFIAVNHVLGFSALPVAFERALARFQGQAEMKTGKKGGEAFGAFVQELMLDIEAGHAAAG